MRFIFTALKKIFSSNRSPLSPLEKRIKYQFKNKAYLNQAFVHKSISPLPRQNYERLEFLGDAVIDIVVSKLLMKEFPDGDEGLLTQKRAALVQKSYLASMGTMLDLMDHLNIETSVDLSIDKVAEKQQANLYESLIGGMYLGGGINPCRKLIMETIWAHREIAWKSTNYKGKLIEYCHQKSIGNPLFQVKDVTGPDHSKTFEVQVNIDNEPYQTGIATNKKAAEQLAAKYALDVLGAVL
jgi:ribonuclease-3